MASSGGAGATSSPFDTYTGPDGGSSGLCLAQTIPRQSAGSNSLGLGSGALVIAAVYLPAGVKITKLGWCSSGTAAVTPTNQWMALLDKSYNLLATTADGTTAAIPADTAIQYDIAETAAGAATEYVTTYSGLYYIGLCVVATTQPNAIGNNMATYVIGQVSPLVSGYTANGVFTGPPSFPYQLTTPTGTAGVRYYWAS